jgi:transcriptional regulator with XRE-family HTH domain
LVRLRGDAGWSQERLGFEAGLHRTFVAHVERGARNPSLDNIERLAVALGVDVVDLFLTAADVVATTRRSVGS